MVTLLMVADSSPTFQLIITAAWRGSMCLDDEEDDDDEKSDCDGVEHSGFSMPGA